MSDSEDSNFSEEEDSERSSDGEEAEVCGWNTRVALRVGVGGGGPGRTRAEGPLGSSEGIRMSSGLWELPGGLERSRQAQIKQRDGCWRPGMLQVR